MNRQEIDQKYLQEIANRPDQYRADFKLLDERVSASRATYKDLPVPYALMPKFYSESDIAQFEKIAEDMMALSNKVIDLYFEHPWLRKKYGFSKRLEQLILKESPYHSQLPMARFDIFYRHAEDYMFCEINTDGSSAMNEDNELAKIFVNSQVIEALSAHYSFEYFELFDSWIDELLAIYREATQKQTMPTVAIVDLFKESGPNNEFKLFLEHFERRGIETYLADARQLSYQDGLYYRGKKIDVVYRRLVTRDMMAHIEELAAFEQACLDDRTVIIGNIRSQIVHTKLFFSMLHDERVRAHLSAEMCDYIDRHIPPTQTMDKLRQRIDYYVAHKDDYLLKPLDYYASIGVYAGSELSTEQWREKIMQADDNYLIQRYCPPVYSQNIQLKNDQFVIDDYRNITGLFVYNNKFKGVYSRLGREAIISGLHDVYTQPTFLVKAKRP